ncbi:MAG: glycosyltransferase family 9 protein [Bryobacteraceae bacterium]|nr:glycosyltransferase family 9 protein [Bryobacteraceae bacterium]MDW8377441.1 glycosyltransferase family 9 protein [Bryobacterales bacterium]
MACILDQLGKGAHVGIVRLRSLGDCVLTTPAIRLLKEHRPDLRLGVVCEARFAAVFESNPDVDDLVEPSLRALYRFAPHLCVNLHGGMRSLLLTLFSGARYRAGFEHFRFSALYNVRIPRAQQILGVSRKVHTAEHLASAMFYLGVPVSAIPRARVYAKPLRSTTPYAVIHPFASSPAKTWPADRFCAVAEYMRRQMDLEPIFVGGPGDDLARFRPFRLHSGSLEDTKRLFQGASLFVGNDSGPAHLAAASGIPVVVLFAASDPTIWGPWQTVSETIFAPGGISSIPVSRVVEALDRLRVKA